MRSSIPTPTQSQIDIGPLTFHFYALCIIAGIATAIRLKKAGYAVSVYEANAQAGGKLAEIRQEGFRFDAGPSLFTMPQYVEELFRLHGKNPTDYFEYEQMLF